MTNILHTVIVPEILEGMVFGDVTNDLTTISDKTKQKVTKKLKKFGLGDNNASNPEDALKGLIKGLF